MNKPITSREYKLLLNSERFIDREKGTADLSGLIKDITEEMSCSFGEYSEELKRVTWYLDTEDNDLYKNNYILRIRDESIEKERYKLMLKYRHADRYISSSKNNYSPLPYESKFEEDILPPFTSRFSNSAVVISGELPKLKKLKHAMEYFPVLGELGLKNKVLLAIKGNFKAYEIVKRIGFIDMGGELPVKASINFWYRKEGCSGIPMISELSFDYEAENMITSEENSLEFFHLSTVTNAEMFYRILQNKKCWFQKSSSISKTKYAYEMM